MRLEVAIPTLPVHDIDRSATFYEDVLGFEIVHQENEYCILRRDAVEIHLWAANDEGWRDRNRDSPVLTGAESFIAGTAGCRLRVTGIKQLYEVLQRHGVLHPNGLLEKKPWGTQECAIADPDNNLITFYEPA